MKGEQTEVFIMNGILKDKERSSFVNGFTAEESELIAFYGRRVKRSRAAEKNANGRLCFTVMRKKSEAGFLPPEKTAALRTKKTACGFGESFADNDLFFGGAPEALFVQERGGEENKVFDENIGGGSFFAGAGMTAGAEQSAVEGKFRKGSGFENGFSTESELWARERFYKAILSACNPL